MKPMPEIEMDGGDMLTVKLTKDLKAAVKTINRNEARYLIGSYMQMQENRLRAQGQIRAMTASDADDSTNVLQWASDTAGQVERQIALALKHYAQAQPMGEWAMKTKGVGPVFAATLIAHIDIEKAPTVGHIWRFAGLDPTQKWGKGQKRPWNADLKRCCFLIGCSFEKLHNDPESYYGKIYNERKAYEQAKNEKGDYADQAKQRMETKPVGKDTEAYKFYTAGKLPPGHIRMRVLRYVVKLFLSHWHEEAYKQRFNCQPPLPYPIAHLNHAHLSH